MIKAKRQSKKKTFKICKVCKQKKFMLKSRVTCSKICSKKWNTKLKFKK